MAVIATMIILLIYFLSGQFPSRSELYQRLVSWTEFALFFMILVNILKLFYEGVITTTTIRRCLFNISAYLIILSIPYLITTSKRLKLVLFALIFGTIFIFFTYTLAGFQQGSFIRVFGGIGNPLWAMTFFLALLCARELKIDNWFGGVVAVISVLLIVLSIHRSAYIALAISLLFLLVFKPPKKINPKVLVTMFAIITMSSLMFPFIFHQEAKTLENRFTQIIDDKTGTYYDRYERLHSAIFHYEKNKLFGVPFAGDQKPFIRMPHNVFYEYLLIGGLMGITAGIFLISMTIALFGKTIFINRHKNNNIILALAAGYLFTILYVQANTSVRIFEETLYFYLSLGLMLAIVKNNLFLKEIPEIKSSKTKHQGPTADVVVGDQ
jgi:O-antigen ligase